MSDTQKIIPNLWYDREAEQAAALYASVFPNSKVGTITRASKAGYETHGLPEGTAMTVEFEIENYRFIAINGGPIFKFNPAISFLVACETTGEVDRIWNKLFPGGTALMKLGEYPFSKRYGWTIDRFGLSWQIMATGVVKVEQKIIPTLMFVGDQCGKSESAVNHWVSIFDNARVGDIMRYGKGEEPDKAGTIKHAGFRLENQEFAAMDSAHNHQFTFNEAISLMVVCENQQQIDRYWAGLTGDGGQESFCGWLKDKFGVSWQVVPTVLSKMLQDPDKAKVERVTNAFLKMKKFDIAALQGAYLGP
jgi:predicted 3-demethylubiquinone-9 3-methyltransferase (glyoxalase superfamily)